MPDKFTATWTSHSSISDFLRCPKTYYFKNIYRDPKNNHKIKLTGPALALGQAVHETLESLSVLPKNRRFDEPLMVRFERAWEKVKGKKGGFLDESAEYKYKTRGQEMIRRAMNHPGPLEKLAVKIQMDLPYFWLSEEENLILCGKIDWLEYLPETDSVHIIDFKTGKNEEDKDSLQLPIYHLLVHYCQKRKVSKASYWYLESSDELIEKQLPELEQSQKQLLDIARQIKLMRQLKKFNCPNGAEGCGLCQPYQEIIDGRAELVGVDDFGYDVYILNNSKKGENREGVIL